MLAFRNLISAKLKTSQGPEQLRYSVVARSALRSLEKVTMMRTIHCKDLTLTDIPPVEADLDALIAFAHTFDGYRHWGSFEQCAEIANAQDHESLEKLRTCLFFEARRWRHFGEDPDTDAEQYWRKLVAAIRREVQSRGDYEERDADMKHEQTAEPSYRESKMPNLTDPCGAHFLYRDFIECGETQTEYKIANLPKQPETYAALFELAKYVLDPTWKQFGPLQLTYGFCSLELLKKIPDRIAPKLDQHSSHEKRENGNFICQRLGAACDFIVAGTDMREVAKWIYHNTEVDRIYFYGSKKPLHVSFSKTRAHQFVEFTTTENSRRVPRVVRNP